MHERARKLLLSPLPAFALLSLVYLWIHEPWRDEAQPWMIARDSPNLFRDMDSEGTPALWYVLLWPLAKVGLPFLAERVLHLLLACASLALVVGWGPFSRLEQWLLAGSYFVAYEYDAIARSYVLTMLLLFAVAALHARRREHPLVMGIVLLLLANTTGFGMLMALMLGGAYLLDAWWDRAWRCAAWIVLPAALGVLLAWWQMIPAPDVAAWRNHWITRPDRYAIVDAARGVLHAFVPLGDWTRWAWNRDVLDALPGWAFLLCGAAGWALSFLPFRRQPRVMLLWLGLSGSLIALYYMRSGVAGQIRHHGMLFVSFLFCVWIARIERPTPLVAPWRRGRQVAALSLAALLALQVVATAEAVHADATQPFSGGTEVATYLRAHGLTGNRTLVGVYPDFIAPPLLAPLDRDAPRALFLQTMEMRSYVRWTQEDERTFYEPGDISWKLENASRGADYDHVLLVASIPVHGPNEELLLHVDSLSPGDGMYLYEVACGSACPPRG